MHCGFIGLGNLGGPLAISLCRSGLPVVVHDRNPELAARPLQAGARWAPSVEELARNCDTVITCLPSPAASESVLREMLPTLPPASTWIEMSTLGLNEIERLAGMAAAAGVRVLEAPVTGGVHLAEQGRITVLVGGDVELLEAHRPLLEAMGEQIFHMGRIGSAARIKIITNMLAFIHLIATGEALMLAARGGLDLGQAWRAVKASSGNSFVHETEGQLILSGSYDIGFTMDLALKDLGFALDMGRASDVPLALASLAEDTFRRGREAFGGAAQSTQIVKLLEYLLDTPLRAPGFPDRLLPG